MTQRNLALNPSPNKTGINKKQSLVTKGIKLLLHTYIHTHTIWLKISNSTQIYDILTYYDMILSINEL